MPPPDARQSTRGTSQKIARPTRGGVGCRGVREFRKNEPVLRHYRLHMATFTGAIGAGSKWLLDKIVAAIAATGINPNLLTFLGLVVNFAAAAFFAVGGFRTGAIIIFCAGFLDMLDGQVARRQNRVTPFGAFYDSTLDRYADMALYMGLLVYYSVSGRTPYVVLAALCAGSRRIAHPLVQSGFYGTPGAPGAPDHWRAVQSHGPGVVGHRRRLDHHGRSPHPFYLARNQGGSRLAGNPAFCITPLHSLTYRNK